MKSGFVCRLAVNDVAEELHAVTGDEVNAILDAVDARIVSRHFHLDGVNLDGHYALAGHCELDAVAATARKDVEDDVARTARCRPRCNGLGRDRVPRFEVEEDARVVAVKEVVPRVPVCARGGGARER